MRTFFVSGLIPVMKCRRFFPMRKLTMFSFYLISLPEKKRRRQTEKVSFKQTDQQQPLSSASFNLSSLSLTSFTATAVLVQWFFCPSPFECLVGRRSIENAPRLGMSPTLIPIDLPRRIKGIRWLFMGCY